ncbi:MAG: nuclear transport factor 2 family protein [Rhodobiaceae bacterium]|nr:nuclear transport factor 2 family protein [Rhodobiaceae bacterium]MCC0015231.1 nuclear transport factor 2 family protein [Rhodobiaceae bacterium]MCC0053528.1 nuclear transport factor 2 family protein [Rhodobiaceae bacterium]
MAAAATRALIARYYDAFNARDIAGMLACLHEDVAHDINEGERQIGHAAFERFLIHMNRCYRERLDAIEVMTNESGLRAAAEFVVHGEYLATDDGLPEARGQTYVLPAGCFFEIDDGLISRVTLYYNLKHWIAQVRG